MKGGRISPIDRKIYHKATVFKAVCCFLSDKDISKEGPETDRPRDRPAQTGTGPGTDNIQGQNVKILKPEVENMDYHYNLGIAKAFENNHQMHKL